MSYRLILSDKADSDLIGASVWYEQKAEGLGTKFKEVIGRKLRLIEQYPERYPIKKGNSEKPL